MEDPLPGGQVKGLGEALPRDGQEGGGGAPREYHLRTLIGPCGAANQDSEVTMEQRSKRKPDEPQTWEVSIIVLPWRLVC